VLMPKITRYGIYWVDLRPVIGREIDKARPCIVVSPQVMHEAGIAVVCPVTSRVRRYWAHRIQISIKGRECDIMPDQIRAVSLRRFGKFIAVLNSAEVEKLKNILLRLYIAD
jgi:mRNA interferase MazF